MISNEKFDQVLLDKIKEEKISPRPRWQFLAKNYVLWFFGGLSLLLGSLAMALIIYMVQSDDWRLYARPGHNPVESILLLVPFFWIICLGLFLVVIYYEFKKTKKGYRYPAWAIILAAVGASIILGGIFYALGLSQKIDDILGRRAPFYEQVINPRLRFWSDPSEGRLSGMVKTRVADNHFILVDMDRSEWDLLLELQNEKFQSIIRVGEPARFVGQQNSANQFTATEVMPLTPGREFFNRPGDKKAGRGNDLPPAPAPDFIRLLERYPDLKASFISDLEQETAGANDYQAAILLEFLRSSTSLDQFGR